MGRAHWVVAALVAAGGLSVFFPFFWMAVTSLKTVSEIQRVPILVVFLVCQKWVVRAVVMSGLKG